MSTATTTHASVARRDQPPMLVAGPVAWARANLFNSVWSSLVTLASGDTDEAGSQDA